MGEYNKISKFLDPFQKLFKNRMNASFKHASCTTDFLLILQIDKKGSDCGVFCTPINVRNKIISDHMPEKGDTPQNIVSHMMLYFVSTVIIYSIICNIHYYHNVVLYIKCNS